MHVCNTADINEGEDLCVHDHPFGSGRCGDCILDRLRGRIGQFGLPTEDLVDVVLPRVLRSLDGARADCEIATAQRDTAWKDSGQDRRHLLEVEQKWEHLLEENESLKASIALFTQRLLPAPKVEQFKPTMPPPMMAGIEAANKVCDCLTVLMEKRGTFDEPEVWQLLEMLHSEWLGAAAAAIEGAGVVPHA